MSSSFSRRAKVLELFDTFFFDLRWSVRIANYAFSEFGTECEVVDRALFDFETKYGAVDRILSNFEMKYGAVDDALSSQEWSMEL